MNKYKRIIGIIFLCVVIFFTFKKKNVNIIIISGLEKGVDFEVYLNDKLVFDSLVEQQLVLHQNFLAKTNSGFNRLRVKSNDINLDQEYNVFVLLQQWVVMVLHEDDETGEIDFYLENEYFRHYMM